MSAFHAAASLRTHTLLPAEPGTRTRKGDNSECERDLLHLYTRNLSLPSMVYETCMTEEQPHRALTERIAALEAAMTGLEKSLAYQEEMFRLRLDQFDARNRAQDQEQEEFAKIVKGKFGEYDKMLLKTLGWLATAVAGMMLAAVWKVLGIGSGG